MKNNILVNESRCPSNHACPVINACPVGAIKQETINSAPVIDESKCTKCGKCTFYCPFGAFQMN